MNVFERAKERVTVREAARFYGLQPGRGGMVRCPFHPDGHPSMKLNDRYFFCFGCGATGDVVELVSKRLDFYSVSAAERLCRDFGLDASNRERERQCFLALRDYLLLLRSWKEKDAPETLNGPFSDRFCEACQMEVFVEDLLDALLLEPEEIRRKSVETLSSIVPELKDYVKRKKDEDDETERIGA